MKARVNITLTLCFIKLFYQTYLRILYCIALDFECFVTIAFSFRFRTYNNIDVFVLCMYLNIFNFSIPLQKILQAIMVKPVRHLNSTACRNKQFVNFITCYIEVQAKVILIRHP